MAQGQHARATACLRQHGEGLEVAQGRHQDVDAVRVLALLPHKPAPGDGNGGEEGEHGLRGDSERGGQGAAAGDVCGWAAQRGRRVSW